MTVKFHPAARTELLEARIWYEERSPLAAVALPKKFQAPSPGSPQIRSAFRSQNGTRRIALRRFPYNGFYRIGAEETIVVVAVAHQKRRP